MLANVATKTVRDRWRGMAIGAFTIGLLLVLGMSAYREIDLSVYTDLPEVFRSLMHIPKDADVASLAYGAIYGSYGAMTVAALSLAMGSASIAGEERDGTIGLLLGNPKSRTAVLVSKAASMVLLTALGAGVLWGAARIAPAILDVNVTGMKVEALILHLFLNALFYGFLAMAIGAWTGSKGLASGAAGGVMVVSFIAVGIFPLISGWENVAEAFPWYYFIGSDPVINGADWAHIAVLAVGSSALGLIALLGVNRRDLRGQTVGVTLGDRLRANPLTHKVVDRLAGATRVSRIWIKTASEHQGVLIVTAGLMFLMCLMIGPMYPLIDDALVGFSDGFPEALLALFGGGDIATPQGWFQVEIFGMMGPVAVMVVTVVIGARALAGEEERRTMGLLLANPIPRSTVVLEKVVTMVVFAFAVGLAMFGGVALGSALGGLGVSVASIAATCLLMTLVGLAFGALALMVGAGTGRVKVAVFVSVGAAIALHVLNALLPLNDSLIGYARWSPFYYYLSSDPLNNGMHWGHGAVLGALALLLTAGAVIVFERRDLRQTG
jgi:ABC-2 type transport system permease protein